MMLYKDQKGVILLLALVTDAVILAAALVLSTIIVRDIRLSQTSDKANIAFYGSESISEETLYEVINQGTDPLTLDATNGTLSTGVTWTRTASDTTNTFVFDFLPANRTQEVDLYNTANPDSAADISSVNFQFSNATQLDVIVEEWDGSALSSFTTASFTCNGPSCGNNIALNPGRAYKLTLDSGAKEVSDLIVTTSPAANEVESGTRVNIRAEYEGAAQEVQFTLPKTAPWNLPPPPPPPGP